MILDRAQYMFRFIEWAQWTNLCINVITSPMNIEFIAIEIKRLRSANDASCINVISILISSRPPAIWHIEPNDRNALYN